MLIRIPSGLSCKALKGDSGGRFQARGTDHVGFCRSLHRAGVSLRINVPNRLFMKFTLLLLAAATALSSASFAEDKEITIDAAGVPALKLSVPKEAEVTTKGEKTTVQVKTLFIYIWRVSAAKSVSAAVSDAGEIIKGEFVKFAAQSKETIKVLGHDATHLKGKGEEADDNDPGTADVVLFTDGKNVWAACVHGERDQAVKERPELLKALASAKAL